MGKDSRTQTRHRAKRGMTLIEVAIAMTIFAIAVASVFGLVNQGFSMVERSRDINRVTQTMQHQMENLRATPWSDFVNLPSASIYYADSSGAPTLEETSTPPFGWTSFQLYQYIVPSKTSYYLVVLTALWVDRDNELTTRSYISTFTENGLNEYYTRSAP